MVYKFFPTENEYHRWCDSATETEPEKAKNTVPVYPPREIERIYKSHIDGLRWVFAAMQDAVEDPAQTKAEYEEAEQKIEESKKNACRLWQQHGGNHGKIHPPR